MERVDRWTAPLFVLFFVLSGAELELSVFADIAIVLVGIVYILSRSAGKYSGAYISAKAAGCDEKITKYLGVTLLPQAGVALGMAIKSEAPITLCSYLLRKLNNGKLNRILFCGTGALLSPTSVQQGLSIPGICHAVSIVGGK